MLFVDLKAAFDSIDRELLIEELLIEKEESKKGLGEKVLTEMINKDRVQEEE